MNESELSHEKSLMETLDLLTAKAFQLKDLANFSDEVLDRLNKPRLPQEKTEPNNEKIKGTSDLSLTNLLLSVANEIETATGRIGKNIEKIRVIIG